MSTLMPIRVLGLVDGSRSRSNVARINPAIYVYMYEAVQDFIFTLISFLNISFNPSQYMIGKCQNKIFLNGYIRARVLTFHSRRGYRGVAGAQPPPEQKKSPIFSLFWKHEWKKHQFFVGNLLLHLSEFEG